jgi:aminomuconate-semialdehyde/2-hydroxymuconate-6-semialdehyde dehydrogenase
LEKVMNYIGGELRDARTGQWVPNFDPAVGAVYGAVPDSDEGDVSQAVEAARKAFPAWSKKTAEERAQILRRLADKLQENLEDFARAESLDSGKPLSVARTVDIPRSIRNLGFFADAATQFASESHVDGAFLNYTLRSPLGVVGCISPWNLPLYLFTWKIAPALAAGNTVVAKPSEITPMTAYLFSKLCVDAGLPAGVLNVVHGLGPKVGAAMSANPHIKALSFTGSTRTGAEISRTAGPSFKKLSLEMGGKNAYIVFADADMADAVSTAVRAAFSNQGQICLCGSRIFVEKRAYDSFKQQREKPACRRSAQSGYRAGLAGF